MPVANPNLSYPKARGCVRKIFPIARTDSNTLKCVLPKDAVVTSVYCLQNVNAATAAATWTVGWAGATGALLNGFSAATTAVGLVLPGTAAGSAILQKQEADRAVVATFGGSSTAGGTGFVIVEYFTAGAGETADD